MVRKCVGRAPETGIADLDVAPAGLDDIVVASGLECDALLGQLSGELFGIAKAQLPVTTGVILACASSLRRAWRKAKS